MRNNPHLMILEAHLVNAVSTGIFTRPQLAEFAAMIRKHPDYQGVNDAPAFSEAIAAAADDCSQFTPAELHRNKLSFEQLLADDEAEKWRKETGKSELSPQESQAFAAGMQAAR